MVKLFTGLAREKADIILLVLASQGITPMIRPCPGPEDQDLDLFVPLDQTSQALFHVNQYFMENCLTRTPGLDPIFRVSSFYSPTAFVIMGLLILIHVMGEIHKIHHTLVLEFGSSALYILQGETFRAVTSLFLHADARHLLGNLGGLLIFGAPLISLSGYGTGPFLLLFAGTGGNLINAWFQGNARLSIGASTAIMGAAGCLAAFQMTRKKAGSGTERAGTRIWNRLVPFFACATLVAMFSHGENTDVSAHLFGFITGLGLGIFFFPFHRTFEHRLKEPVFLGISILILVSAILSGLAAEPGPW
ncbi:rhomboid family intramembrane serine protease [Desulfospira joergensenii]|uniref:rhomboid family intramembrane serine protease n=1 Tax=Desulfospira joergensenii TaxID=53329 RepID=UPI000424A8F6|nr:rhomboid family intramembrane serine protease [Desulfospira joergensenii]